MGGYGAPSFTGFYGGRLGPAATGQSPQVGGPNYNPSPIAGGTPELAAGVEPDADVVQAGFLGQPLVWWTVIVGLLILMTLMGGRD